MVASKSLFGLGGLSLLLAGCAGHSLSDRECMTRAMYFESNRSSTDGMLAVGTTVMNRLENPKFPKTVCGVVGQPHQYAPGVLTNRMIPREAAYIGRVADAVLAGARHPQVGKAMYFHTAGMTFPYTNMHYVAVAGGNAFYERVSTRHWSPDGTTGSIPEQGMPEQGPGPESVAVARDRSNDEAPAAFAPDLAAEPSPLVRSVTAASGENVDEGLY